MNAKNLTSEALKLPASDRVQLIETLWGSLDPAEQTSIDGAWLAEARERYAAYKSGKIDALEGESVLREVENDLRNWHTVSCGQRRGRSKIPHGIMREKCPA